ncbi:uncharacterized protein LOC126854214 [Cataglyphis hispanica]|uniref:uncharacterized protein LOC126854214 n=1 Tax=Cataglyphis hispanica TaxID=1086592 RepID=UPI00217F342E|nr:uncharacterized protein LOC126854214 [Cataglyphis hispanica]
MAKRRTINRSSKRFSKNKSNSSINSGFLDPDTSIMSEEQTHWWKNLDENMSSSPSLIHNNRNETTQQLNLNSELESNHNTSQWWKYLESPNSRSNTSRRSKPNLSAAINTANILETSTSESEKELSLRKRKVPLKVASRKSDNKAFLNALNDTEVAIPIKWRLKQTQHSNLDNNLDKEISKKKLDENKKDDSNLSSSPSSNILKLKPHIFKRRKGRETSSENPFQDIVKEDDSLKRRKSITFEKESSKHSIHQNINTNKDQIDDQRKIIQVSQTLPLENNEAGPSNLSTSNTIFENNVAFDINKTVETSDESDFEISKHKRFKFKSHLMQRARRSMSNDPFKDALVENRDITSSKHNEDKEIVIDGAKSPLKTPTKLLSSPSKKIVNRSRGKTDVTHENVIASSPIRRSPRSLKTTKKHLLDTTKQVEENVEQNTSSSLDSNEFHFKRPTHLKLKSKIPVLHKKSLTNPFKEILKENGNARQSNIAMSPEDNHISVEQDQIIAEISQEHEQIMEENYSRSKTGSVSVSKVFDTSLKILSNSGKNVSENFNVQSNRLSENDDIMNVSKSNSQRNVIIEDRSKDRSNKSSKKRFSFSRKSIRDISEISKDHTNAISPANRTNTNEIEACKIISDYKSFIAKDASSILNVQNLLTSQVAKNFENIKVEVDRLKIREMTAMKMAVEKKESALKTTTVKLFGATRKQSMKKNISPKVVDKAYLVNGKVYKPPRLPRPKHWATDHLYKFLWKRMEPKYQLSTRVRSEKFVVLLSKIVSIITRRKKYENYKLELDALMKEMARLNIINTRNDFHHFCQDFLPYEFRIKVIPMLLPGNKQNIPFELEKLHIPLLEET